MHSIRGTKRQTDKFISFERIDDIDLLYLLCEFLVCHVKGRSLGADEDIVVLHLDGYVVSSGENEATGLSVHRFGSQGSSNKEDISAREGLLESDVEFCYFDLDETVLIDTDSFAF